MRFALWIARSLVIALSVSTTANASPVDKRLAKYLISAEDAPAGWAADGADGTLKGTRGTLCPTMRYPPLAAAVSRNLSDDSGNDVVVVSVTRFATTADAGRTIAEWRAKAPACAPKLGDFAHKVTRFGAAAIVAAGDESGAFRSRFQDASGNGYTFRVIVFRVGSLVGLVGHSYFGGFSEADATKMAQTMARRMAAG